MLIEQSSAIRVKQDIQSVSLRMLSQSFTNGPLRVIEQNLQYLHKRERGKFTRQTSDCAETVQEHI